MLSRLCRDMATEKARADIDTSMKEQLELRAQAQRAKQPFLYTTQLTVGTKPCGFTHCAAALSDCCAVVWT